MATKREYMIVLPGVGYWGNPPHRQKSRACIATCEDAIVYRSRQSALDAIKFDGLGSGWKVMPAAKVRKALNVFAL